MTKMPRRKSNKSNLIISLDDELIESIVNYSCKKKNSLIKCNNLPDVYLDDNITLEEWEAMKEEA